MGWCISHNAFTALRCLQERATSLLPDPPSWSSSSLLSSLRVVNLSRSRPRFYSLLFSFRPCLPLSCSLALVLCSSPSLSAREMGSFSPAGSCRQQRRTRVRQCVCVCARVRENERVRSCVHVCTSLLAPCNGAGLQVLEKPQRAFIKHTACTKQKEKNSQ